MITPRFKVTFPSIEAAEADSPSGAGCAKTSTRYVYGEEHLLLKDPTVKTEAAGSYDDQKNDCVFTEPTSYFEGRAAPGK